MSWTTKRSDSSWPRWKTLFRDARRAMTLAASRRARPVPWRRRGEPYLAGLTSIFLTSSFFSTLRPTETVRMPWS